MFRSAVCLACALLGVSTASAQVFFEPVQYQYGTENNRTYYGGTDGRLRQRLSAAPRASGFGRSGGWALRSATIDTHREVSTDLARVYSDAVPTWNARVLGYTEVDARNEAYQNAATYFRKSDWPSHATRRDDGALSVSPMNAPMGTIQIRPLARPATRPSTAPAPHPVLIIPRRLLDRPLWDDPDGPGRA